MTDLRAFLPPAGNPVRPAQILLLVFFAANLIGWNIAMPFLGIGSGGAIFVTIVIAIVAVICVGYTWMYGERLERQRARLADGDVWARWQLSPAENELYTARERDSVHKLALGLVLVGLTLGCVSLTIMVDTLGAAVMTGVFLFAALFVFFAGRMPGRKASRMAQDVVIGPNGAIVGNRYIPVRTTGMRLLGVEIAYSEGMLPSLRFTVRSGLGPEARRRATIHEIDIPVPADRISEAEALIERYRSGEPGEPS